MRARAPIIFMMVVFSLPLGAISLFGRCRGAKASYRAVWHQLSPKDAGRPVCAEPGSGPCRQLYFQGASPWRRSLSWISERTSFMAFLVASFGTTRLPLCIVTIFCRITDGFSHLGHAAFIHEIHNQLHLMERFKIGNFRLIASFA
mgnify:CR=1 FL=1